MDAISPSPTRRWTTACDRRQARTHQPHRQPARFQHPRTINAAPWRHRAGFTRYTSPIGTWSCAGGGRQFNRRGSDYTTAEVRFVRIGNTPFSTRSRPSRSRATRSSCRCRRGFYPDMVRLADGVPVMPTAPFEAGYKLTPGLLELSITPRTKAIIFNSPNNPTGAVYSRKEAEALAEVLLRHKITTISDEIYDEIVYDDVRSVCMATLSDEMRRNTITINGVSKAYAMTGWRIGFAADRPDVIEAMGRFRRRPRNPRSISRRRPGGHHRHRPRTGGMRTAFARRRRDHGCLAGTPLVWQAPGGAFYFLIEVAQTYGRKLDGRTIRHGEDLSDILIDRGVAMVPGSGFGAPECIRLSFAASDENLRRGMEIFNTAMEEIARG
jgi:aspartate/methionine/tyrosine aminotransferase